MKYKKYNLSLVIIVAFLLFGFGVAEYFFRKIPNEYQFKFERIKNNETNFNTIILGSSQSYYGLNPDYFDNPTLNLANYTQDLKYDKYLLEKSLDLNKGIKFVILPISYFSFFLDLDTSIEDWRKYFYVHWCDYPSEQFWDINNFSAIIPYPSKTGLLKSMYKYYLIGDFKPSWSSSGWGLDYLDEQSLDLSSTGKSAAKIHSSNGLQYFNRNLQLFNSILDLCKRNNIKVLLFMPPAYISYRQHLDKTVLEKINFIIREAVKLNKNVSYIDLFADDRFVAEDFYDANHLNHTGAKKLSIIVNDYVSKW